MCVFNEFLIFLPFIVFFFEFTILKKLTKMPLYPTPAVKRKLVRGKVVTRFRFTTRDVFSLFSMDNKNKTLFQKFSPNYIKNISYSKSQSLNQIIHKNKVTLMQLENLDSNFPYKNHKSLIIDYEEKKYMFFFFFKNWIKFLTQRKINGH